MQIVSYISLGLLGLAGIVLLVHTLIGLKRGFGCMLLRLACIAVSAVFAFLVTLAVNATVAPKVGEFLLEEANQSSAVRDLISASPTLESVIESFPGAIVSMIVFLVLFFVFCLLTLIPYAILKHLPGIRSLLSKGLVNRLLGAALGLVVGFVCLVCTFFPLAGLVSFADGVLGEIKSSGVLEESQTDDIREDVLQADAIVTKLNDNFSFITVNALGGKAMFNRFFTVRAGEKTVRLERETAYLLNLFVRAKPLIDTEFDLSRFGAKEAAALRSLGEGFGDSDLIPPVLGEILPAAAGRWESGLTFADLENPLVTEDELLQPTFNRLLSILKNTNEQTLKEDIRTVTEVLAQLSESGVLAALGNDASQQELLKALAKEGVLSGLIGTLANNERMRDLVADVSNIGFRVIGEALNIPEDDTRVYNALVNDLTDEVIKAAALENKEAQIRGLSSGVQKVCARYGVDIDKEQADLYASCLLETNGNTPTPEKVAGTFQTLSRNRNGSDGETADLTAQLAGLAPLHHAAITMNDLLLNDKDIAALSANTLYEQAKSVEILLNTFAEAITTNGDGKIDIDIDKLDAAVLSQALIAFADTRGDGKLHNIATSMTGLITCALQMAGVDAKAAGQLVNHITDGSSEKSVETLKNAMNLIKVMNSESENSQQEVKDIVSSLVQDMDKESSAVLADCISVNLIDKFTGSSLPDERSEAMVTVTKDLLIKFGETQEELTEEQADAEAAYMQTIFDLALSTGPESSTLFDKKDGTDSTLNKTADEFVETIQESTVISQTVVEEQENLKIAFGDTLNNADKEALAEVLTDAEDRLDEDVKNALIHVFDLEGFLNLPEQNADGSAHLE